MKQLKGRSKKILRSEITKLSKFEKEYFQFMIHFDGWLVDWLVGFYDLSTFKGYLMPNSGFTFVKPNISERILRR